MMVWIAQGDEWEIIVKIMDTEMMAHSIIRNNFWKLSSQLEGVKSKIYNENVLCRAQKTQLYIMVYKNTWCPAWRFGGGGTPTGHILHPVE